MEFYSPKNFKSGKYRFGKYNDRDLALLIVFNLIGALTIIGLGVMGLIFRSVWLIVLGFVLGGICIGTILLLTFPMRIYHNVLGRILVFFNYNKKQKKYAWKGYDYGNYEDE